MVNFYRNGFLHKGKTLDLYRKHQYVQKKLIHDIFEEHTNHKKKQALCNSGTLLGIHC